VASKINPSTLPLEEAAKIHDRLVASKLAKDYKADGEPATPYRQSGNEGEDSGIRCQFLNPVGQSEVVRKRGGTVTVPTKE